MNTREKFLSRLRAGLKGLPPSAVNDIMADYNAHFAEAAAHGRTEEEVAAKLGDPARCARELRAEAGLRNWEENRSATAALGAVVAVLGLATLDIFILLPLLLTVAIVVFTFMVTAFCVCLAGALVLLIALFHALPGFGGSWLQGILLGLGLTSGGASGVAFCTLFVIGTVNLLVRYGRLHYRAVEPAIINPDKEYAL